MLRIHHISHFPSQCLKNLMMKNVFKLKMHTLLAISRFSPSRNLPCTYFFLGKMICTEEQSLKNCLGQRNTGPDQVSANGGLVEHSMVRFQIIYERSC